MHTLKTIQELFLKTLEQTSFNGHPASLYEPVHYIMHLGGKRIRPVLALISCDLFGTDPRKAIPAAMAVEIFHNFSLVHDDIMDDAPLRRGQPTVHEKYSANTAILSGDVMLVQAYQALEVVQDLQQKSDLFRVFSQVAVEVCEGQQMDMDFEKRETVTISEYVKMIELKTAALLAGSLQMGAIIAGASKEDIHTLGQVGRNIGIAFQLQDDYLDTFGDPAFFGKKVGGDIAQNKKTYLFLKAMEIADEVQRKDLRACYMNYPGTEEEKISKVIAIFESLGIKSDSKAMMQSYRDEAITLLKSLPNTRNELLLELIEQLMVREV
jgi:geranylgeranyl diphosphate synthase type II